MAEMTTKDINLLYKGDQKPAIEAAELVYHERVRAIASAVKSNSKIRIILLAGPSGSGKTTTANLIADALRTLGEESLVVSLDDFYRDATDPDYPRREDGERDYERPEALNLPFLAETLEKVARGEAFELPRYDFKVAKRTELNRHGPIPEGCVIIEGLHALNPRISESLPRESVLKLFVSVSTNLNSDSEERVISGRKIRFVRRLVRDSIYRDATAERTLDMWHHVLEAEDVYLYPYKESADMAFDTFHTFELGVMKPYALRLLTKELADTDGYVRIVRTALEGIVEVEEALVPQNSLIREFIPGGIYEGIY